MKKNFLLDLEPAELEESIAAMGEPKFRAKQLIKWAYEKKVDSFEQCSDLSKEFREKLERSFKLRSLKIQEKKASALDGTVRYDFLTYDSYHISAVFLPSRDRNSVCLSTQAGCPIGCLFCATGKMRFKRHLSAGEILEQIIQIENDTGKHITGVLFMGMGEPMLNYDNVVKALRAIVNFRQLGIGRRHVIVSTVGLIPKIRKFAEEQLGVRLALSLHAPDDEVRRQFIPPEKVPYSVKEILEAGLYYSRRNNARLTIEYILIPGVNDTLLLAQKFVKLLKKTTTIKDELQVNLIPHNVTGPKWESPDPEAVERFQNYLIKHDIQANIRTAKGADIGAACGQLGV